ncbi:hypothetical protein DB31_0652 [Hyalangium minutum]|uniref:Uncharacterized protein n=1 Tax=Hyalangium minutum TaxID=394096 RepID=A0A085WXH6_9BACT|nr:hypothetical protein DB31_0652 [Hyalangium minutum]
MTPAPVRVKWDCTVSLLLLDSLAGVRYLPLHFIRPQRTEAPSSRAVAHIVGV